MLQEVAGGKINRLDESKTVHHHLLFLNLLRGILIYLRNHHIQLSGTYNLPNGPFPKDSSQDKLHAQRIKRKGKLANFFGAFTNNHVKAT